MEGSSATMHLLVLTAMVGTTLALTGGMLYPRDSESRTVLSLDGMWRFRADMSPTRNMGFQQKWYSRPLDETGPTIPMAVPSSYNDITEDKALRDFVGWVWYQRSFFVPSGWEKERAVLRFGSAHYYAIVYLNGREITRHDGGHLPFEVEVNSFALPGSSNLLTVAVNNTLTPHTLPPGTIEYEKDTSRYPPGYFVQNLQMDFFNYAGIHRSVVLYRTPVTYVDDITITTDVKGSTGIVTYKVKAGGPSAAASVKVELEDMKGKTVASGLQMEGMLSVPSANLWWPYTMKPTEPTYLYSLKVTLTSGGVEDVYRLPVGIRSVEVTSSQLLINHQPFYCHGVAKHEDADIRGKGLDYALIAKDFNMLKWLGANCFRTSHYPYAEEIMDQADQQGIVVIDESPGVGITEPENFSNVSLAHHLEVMAELVRRDKNRPSVIIWSVANEPKTTLSVAAPYFKSVLSYTKQLDPTRPVTFVCNQRADADKAVPYVDIICINRYFGWYSDVGHTEVIQLQLNTDFQAWRSRYNRPIIVTEYGADTVAGLHESPSFVFTEEYQDDFMSEYHKGFDKAKKSFLVGEMVWNFADFMTVQGITRVVGNKKGVLTRQRQPKSAGHLLRLRYHSMFNSSSQHLTYHGCPKYSPPFG